MNVAIFVRGMDKEWQTGVCKDYADKNYYNVVDVVNTTGELSKLVINARIDKILVTHIYRLTRNRLEFETIEQMLRGYGVEIETLVK